MYVCCHPIYSERRALRVLNLHREKKSFWREPGRDGEILCDHRQDGNAVLGRIGGIGNINGAPRVWAEKNICCAQNTDETSTRRL